MCINRKYIKEKRGFSLVEVLISILIISVILLLALPAITKKILTMPDKTDKNSASFFYTSDNAKENGFPCYVTRLDEAGTMTVEDNGGNCSVKEFVVPRGVRKVDITLLAGGGGGGGAAGGTVYKKEFISGESSIQGLSLDRIKKIIVNVLTGSGTSGGTRNTDSDTTRIYSGKGGNSGVAIVDFELPKEFIKANYSPNFADESSSAVELSYIDSTKLAELKNVFDNIRIFDGIGFLIHQTGLSDAVGLYVADAPSTPADTSIECFRGISKENKTSGLIGYYSNNIDDGLSAACSLVPHSYYLSNEGEAPFKESGATVANGFTLRGGNGGRIPGINNAGFGGKGEDAVILCGEGKLSCDIPNNNAIAGSATFGPDVTRIKTMPAEVIDPALNRYGKTTILTEHPGGTGGGGVGGTAVKIKNFPVTPGSKYTIVIGKGGMGGFKGAEGELTDKGYSLTPTDGTEGASGSSSAIYDENKKLVLLVIGGAGGMGGKINQETYTNLPSSNNFSAYLPIPEKTPSSRHYPLILLPDNNVNFTFDEDLITGYEDFGSDNGVIPEGLVAKKLLLSFAKNKNTPIFELNSDNQAVALGSSVDRTSKLNYDKLGGFSAFIRGEGLSLSDLSLVSTVPFRGMNSLNIYNGLFYRNIVGDSLAYAGGLGGFSGLGSKGGCGGLFVGNYNGLTASNTYEYYAVNTITLNTNGTVKTYDFNNFYGNCSTDTSDGHSADFVPPQNTSDKNTTGQAGSGGGGGGWSAKFGSGNGGNGQNGYVFITWKK